MPLVRFSGEIAVWKRRGYMERDLTAGSEGLPDPYVVSYPLIVGIADPGGDRIEVVEFYECIGGAQWVRATMRRARSWPQTRKLAGTSRYVLRGRWGASGARCSHVKSGKP